MTYTIHRQNKIITSHFYDDGDAWFAWHEGDELTQHCGVGTTEAGALADLALVDEERADAFAHIAFKDETDAVAEEGL